jgi:hypothetical protein
MRAQSFVDTGKGFALFSIKTPRYHLSKVFFARDLLTLYAEFQKHKHRN